MDICFGCFGLALLFVLSIGWIVSRNAPRGHEDADGYHNE